MHKAQKYKLVRHHEMSRNGTGPGLRKPLSGSPTASAEFTLFRSSRSLVWLACVYSVYAWAPTVRVFVCL